MMNPEDLTPEQVRAIRSWADAGLDLNAIQKKLHEELQLKLTFMDTRFLLQDLDIVIKQPEPVKTADEAAAEAVPAPAPAPLMAKTQVTVDEVTPPHAVMAGKVLFRSGAQGVWNFDRTGRLNWEPTVGEPTDEDLREFETELQALIRSRFGAM